MQSRHRVTIHRAATPFSTRPPWHEKCAGCDAGTAARGRRQEVPQGRRAGERARRLRLHFGRGRVRGRDRTIGGRQIDPPACRRRAGRTGHRHCGRGRRGRVGDERRRARQVPAAQPRIRVPVLQPGADADRSRERVVAARPRRCAGPISGRARRGATAARRARRPGPAPAGRTVGRTDATGGGGARAGGPAVHHPRRRADRKPGQPLVDRGPGSPALAVRRRRCGGRHGDPRPGRGALRLPRAAPCRRACHTPSTPPHPSRSR